MAKKRSNRGGYRQPANPAPVATPQGGQRTDGGPGSSKQPLRRLPDADYGANKAFVEQQQASPLPSVQTNIPAPNIFAPTERPGEPGTEGVPVGPGSSGVRMTDNVDMMLQAMYEINPSPVILELINNRNR
tara:strand:- start:2282 stop:2674 length:393 start_codon:yes stop_codon:yes gene_type:complete